jgi:D-lyxose ketol-isomerase
MKVSKAEELGDHMKRSMINVLMRDAVEYFAQQKFYLPPFAYWRPADWRGKGPEVAEIVRDGLGWDITDYGLDQFQRYGLLLFTLRNGNPAAWREGKSKPYCEKIMIAEPGQEHQTHFHHRKLEDIINRGGGLLAIRLHNATPQGGLADTLVQVSVNGEQRTLEAGSIVRLTPGESITLTPRLYHKFWAEGSRVMMGEVSTINDDVGDNHFYQLIGTGRFSEIEEDEEPLYLLFSEVQKYWNPEAVSAGG